MKKWIGKLLIVLLLIGAAGIFYRFYFQTQQVELAMEESGKSIANPFRGFYYQADTSDGELPEEIEENDLRLLLLTFDLKEEKREEISYIKIAELENMLKLADKAGIQVIFRAAYGFGSEYRYNDPDLDIILSHIGQIAPVLNEYSENILCVQAGMLGPWGEWHHSNLLGEDEEINKEVRNSIIAQWTELLAEPVTVNVRRPRFIRDALKEGVLAKRLGMHNDALLSGADDMGTYDDEAYTREEELLWIHENLGQGNNGGEMPSVSEYTKPENAVVEFERMHLSYLNSSYNEEVLSSWKMQELGGVNAFQAIEKKLGYRLFTDSIRVTDRARTSRNIELTVSLSNTGFAAAPAGYTVFAAVDHGEKITLYPAEPSKKSVDSQDQAASLTDILPGKKGSFYVKIPAAALQNNPSGQEKTRSNSARIGILISREAKSGDEKAAIRLANDEIVWEDGINYIGSYTLDGSLYRFSSEIHAPSSSEEASGKDSAENGSEENALGDRADRMEMVVFKIGKADAILLMSDDKTLLIDTGEDEDAKEILDYLHENDKKKIDVLILSHFDKDHVGGADKIIEDIEVEQIYQPDYPKDSGQYEEYVQSVERNNVRAAALDETVNFSCGEMEVWIYPPEKDDYEEENDYSLAVTVIHGENRFFFTGDAESARMKELIVKKDQIEGGLTHDFLKVPHHGREDEMLESFIAEVAPSVAVITCSAKNPPDESVVSLLEENGISVYLTMNGNIYAISNGEEITLFQ